MVPEHEYLRLTLSLDVYKRQEFDGTRHKIILNNFITCPEVWMGRESGEIGDLGGGLWGFFSKEKFEEILKRFPELTYEDFMSNETMRCV